MIQPSDKPRIRSLQAFPMKTREETFIVLTDADGYSNAKLPVSPREFFIVQRLNGLRTVLDIQEEFIKQTSEILPADEIENVLAKLDEALLLDNENFANFLEGLKLAYDDLEFRPMVNAGLSYPMDPELLRRQIDGYFTDPLGPGKLPAANNGGNKLKALVAPHIDFQRGGPAYAHAYKALAERSDAEVFVILGIAHRSTRGGYFATSKDFATPFGIVPTDREFLDRLSKHYRHNLFEDEFLHQKEHSVEFEAVCLQYLFGGKRDFKIVPFLCASLAHFETDGPPSYESPEVVDFIAALKKVIGEYDKKVCVIAAVDFSHVGLQFGAKAAVNEESLKVIKTADMEALEFVKKIDAAGFYHFLMADSDSRNTCGIPALYTLLKTIEGSAQHGEFLTYQQAHTKETGSCVSFAAISFE